MSKRKVSIDSIAAARQSARPNLLSRRAVMAGISSAALLRWSWAVADTVNDGLCRPSGLFHSPWLVRFNEQLHPFMGFGMPTIRPGQPIKGTWSLFTWDCTTIVTVIHNLPVTQHQWIGTPDNSHPDWTFTMQFERRDIVSAITQGAFIGSPDSVTQPDFYKLQDDSRRVLNLIIKDKSGTLQLTPGTHLVDLGGASDPSSGSLQMILVADTSISVVFAPSAPADGTMFNWKVDTFTVDILAKTIMTIQGAPFSAMTATGTITFSDETSVSPLSSQTFPYSISIPAGSAPLFAATATTGPQTIQWPWFDHTPLGGINGPLKRTVKYDLSGMIADTFGNQYPVAAATRTYTISVSATKEAFLLASIDNYSLAIAFGADSLIFGVIGGIAAAIGGTAGQAAGAIFGAIATGEMAIATYFTIVAAGDQSNAADPPVIDPNYGQLYEYAQQPAEALPKAKETENLRQFAIACGIITAIYPALTTTEGRILGARAARDTGSLLRQQRHLASLLQTLSRAASGLNKFANPAIRDVHATLNNTAHPITSKQLADELARWPREGIPKNLAEAWRRAGMSAEDMEVIRVRLDDSTLRDRVLDFNGNIESVKVHLTDAAKGAQHEAQQFLALRL